MQDLPISSVQEVMPLPLRHVGVAMNNAYSVGYSGVRSQNLLITEAGP